MKEQALDKQTLKAAAEAIRRIGGNTWEDMGQEYVAQHVERLWDVGPEMGAPMKHVYIAHPLGSGPDREENRLTARRWVAWAAEQGVVPVASWVSLAAEWPETPDNRRRGLAIDLSQIDRCDEVWLCGPRVSPGMTIEANHARAKGIPVLRFVDAEETIKPASRGLSNG